MMNVNEQAEQPTVQEPRTPRASIEMEVATKMRNDIVNAADNYCQSVADGDAVATVLTLLAQGTAALVSEEFAVSSLERLPDDEGGDIASDVCEALLDTRGQFEYEASKISEWESFRPDEFGHELW